MYYSSRVLRFKNLLTKQKILLVHLTLHRVVRRFFRFLIWNGRSLIVRYPGNRRELERRSGNVGTVVRRFAVRIRGGARWHPWTGESRVIGTNRGTSRQTDSLTNRRPNVPKAWLHRQQLGSRLDLYVTWRLIEVLEALTQLRHRGRIRNCWRRHWIRRLTHGRLSRRIVRVRSVETDLVRHPGHRRRQLQLLAGLHRLRRWARVYVPFVDDPTLHVAERRPTYGTPRCECSVFS